VEDIYGGALVKVSEFELDQAFTENTCNKFNDVIQAALDDGRSFEYAIQLAYQMCRQLNTSAELMLRDREIVVQTYSDGTVEVTGTRDMGAIGNDTIAARYHFGESFPISGVLLGYTFGHTDVDAEDHDYEPDASDFNIMMVMEPSPASSEYLPEGLAVISLRDIANSRLGRINYN